MDVISTEKVPPRLLRNSILEEAVKTTHDKKLAKKLIGIHMVGCQLIRAIELIGVGAPCEVENPVWDDVPNELFSWSYDHWKSRRKNKNIIWLNLLLKRVHSSCLEDRKRFADIKDLRNFLILLINSYYDNEMAHAEHSLRAAGKFLGIDLIMARESTRHSVHFYREVYRTLAFNFVHRCLVIIRPIIEARQENSDLINPIEMRYVLRFQKVTENQAVFFCKNKNEKLEQEIYTLLKRIHDEKKCTQCCTSAYFVAIQHLRDATEKWAERYDMDLDKLENAISYKKTQLKAMAVKRQAMEDNMKYFKEMIAESDERQQRASEREAEMKEAQKMAEEERKVKKIRIPRRKTSKGMR